MSVTDWLFGVIIVGFVAVLCLGAAVGGLDLSTRESRAYALIVSLVMGVGFFVLADAWIGIGFPVAVLVFISAVYLATRNRPPVRSARERSGQRGFGRG